MVNGVQAMDSGKAIRQVDRAEALLRIDSAEAIRRVNDTLEGPVVDILSRLVPELKRLPRAQAFERTLDDIGLLERCFTAFRGNRDKFLPVLKDRNRNPVADETTPLSCGRTLEDVVAMVVRTAAKRYFRHRLDPQGAHIPVATRLRREVQQKGFAHRIKSLFKDEPVKAQRRHYPHADELYQAIREYLRHDWQVPMVPTYAGMAPALVRSLGAKILDVRELDHLKRIANDPEEAAKLFDLPEAEAAPEPTASPIMDTLLSAAPVAAEAKDERAQLALILTPDGKRLNASAFEGLLLRPDIRKHLPDPTQAQRNTQILRGVGAVPVKLLVAELGLKMDQLTVMLLVSQDILGIESFGRMFGQPGDAATVMRLAQRARQAGLGQQSSLAECGVLTRRMFEA